MFMGLMSLSIVGVSLSTTKALPLHEEEDGRYEKLGLDAASPNHDPIIARRHKIYGKLGGVRALLARDLASVSFDIAPHHDVASVHEYRGFLHWHRDLTEKLLSIFLVVVFSVFLARAFGFLADFMSGNSLRLALIHEDVDLAIKIVGLALVIDGVILVGGMTDAPGIRRTLDAVIVVLAGVAVLAAHAAARALDLDPKNGWFALALAGGLTFGLCLLFGVRWVVQHRSLRGLRGDPVPPATAQAQRLGPDHNVAVPAAGEPPSEDR